MERKCTEIHSKGNVQNDFQSNEKLSVVRCTKSFEYIGHSFRLIGIVRCEVSSKTVKVSLYLDSIMFHHESTNLDTIYTPQLYADLRLANA